LWTNQPYVVNISEPVKRILGPVLGVAVCVIAFPGSAASQTDKVDRALRDAIQAGAQTQHVIISVKPGYRPTVRQALEDHGDLVKADHVSIEAVSAEVHAGDISQLALQPWVEGVSLDADVFAEQVWGIGAPTLPPPSSPINAPNTRLRESLGLAAVAGAGSPTGKGVVVAIIDSGISVSQDLDASRIMAFYDFTLPGKHPATDVQFVGGQVAFDATCADGSSAGTIVVPIENRSYAVPANGSGWYPSADANASSVYQGSSSVPDRCGGGQISLGKATFTSGILAGDTVSLHYRWHYKAGGSGGGWSSTYSVTPDLIP